MKDRLSETHSPADEPLVRISVPVPPEIDVAFGYHGNARYLGLYWDLIEDALVWTDGHTTNVGGNFSAWFTFTRHPKVASAINEFEFGETRTPARHILLVDRVKRALWVGEFERAQETLTGQWKVDGQIPEMPSFMLTDGVFRSGDTGLAIQLRDEIDAIDAMKVHLDQANQRPFWVRLIRGGRP